MLRNASLRQTDGVIHEQPLTIYERESSAASNDTYLSAKRAGGAPDAAVRDRLLNP